MAPKNGGFYSLIADQFKCKHCMKWKSNTNFSNNEIKKFQAKYYNSHPNRRTDGQSAELRCRPCCGEQVHELTCEGQCGETKPLEEFSKTQRTRGAKWCEECVKWKDRQEIGITVDAATAAQRSPDEVVAQADAAKTPARNYSQSYAANPEYGNEEDDSDDDYDYTYGTSTAQPESQLISHQPVPIHAIDTALAESAAGLGLSEYTSASRPASSTGDGMDYPAMLLPHLRSGASATTTSTVYVAPHHLAHYAAAKSPASASNTGGMSGGSQMSGTSGCTRTDYGFPHQRGTASRVSQPSTSYSQAASEIPSVSSASNPYGSTIDEWQPAGAKATIHQARSTYSANNGAQLPQQSLPSSQASKTSAARQPASADFHAPAPVFQTRANGWAKATGNKSMKLGAWGEGEP
ncbi:Stc1 domain-containing protein [Calycina marina]|uniref:Stc1 domain-containing protein n=1 Tax=Calycina marina TaxID=1763456 RepID=A0A9P8CI99_9HELO|nr:Stc1 domain-containing protein [Calycina marina]